MSDTATAERVDTPEGGSPAETSTRVTARRVLGVGLPVPARRRLLEFDEVELVDQAAEGFDAAVVSARLPRARWQIIPELVAGGVPVIVLVHPGGEEAAVELLELGVTTAIAEGNEAAIVRFLDEKTTEDLVEGYLQHETGERVTTNRVAPTSGLPNGRALYRALAEVADEGRLPRLGMVTVEGLDRAGETASRSIRRRLAHLWRSLVEARGGQLFDLEEDGFAFFANKLDLAASRRLGGELVAAASLFRPDGDPLLVAVGMAGPETASDLETLRALAVRARDRAAGTASRVADADELAHSSATELELAVVLGAADLVDSRDPTGDHHRRVADLAGRIAQTLGLSPDETAKVGLAARIHDLGKVPFGEAAFDDSADDHGRCVAEHAAVGAGMVLHAAGPEVAAAIRGHHEHFDGSGSPDGLAGEDIPIAARILAVADRCDRIVHVDGAAALAELLEEESETRLDPSIVEVAKQLL